MTQEIEQRSFKDIVLKYLKTNFSKKNNIWRMIWFLIASIVVLGLSTPLNIWAYDKGVDYTSGNNNFIIINVVFNLGNGFGFGSKWPQSMVYFLKILTSFIILVFVVFIPHKWYYIFPLSASFVGGIFNIFDKVAHDNYVVDYFELFPQHTWFIFNIPDFFITGGIIFTCVAYIVVFVVQMVKDKKSNQNKK